MQATETKSRNTSYGEFVGGDVFKQVRVLHPGCLIKEILNDRSPAVTLLLRYGARLKA